MPRKERTPASLTLNRESQRRSRARQREFLDQLQQRVREYERRDAQATLEMQRVARDVADENAALREMLAMKGVDERDITAFLEQRKVSRVVEDNGMHTNDDALRIKDQPSESPSIAPSCASAPMTPPTPRPIDGMHCLEAASILAQIRGQSDTTLARQALGCSHKTDCIIRNTDLLQMMDEMT